MAAKVFTVAQQKGGAGKTTIAAHLAVAWTRSGHNVAVVDIDPQQSLSMWYRVRQKKMGDAQAGLLVNQISGHRVRAEVDRLSRQHDIVLIDSPPHMEIEARTAVRAADLVLVPVQPSPMDVWATRPTLDLAKSERKPVLLVLNRVPPRARLTEEMLGEVRGLGVQVADAQIGNRVLFASALAEGRAVGEVRPSSAAAAEIAALADEILRRVG